MELKKKFDIYCWACDFSLNRGEGILARNYVEELSKIQKKKLFIKSLDGTYIASNGKIKKIKTNYKRLKKLNFNFLENYLSPFVGIFFLWINYFKRNGVCYLNFLPLWNIFIFILLPPKTHLGPITGFIYKKKITGINSFLRKYLNSLLFRISLKFVFYRQNQIIFSTDLLKPLIKKKDLKNSYFNFLINMIDIKKKYKKKNIDLLIYNRNYSVKNNYFRNNLLKLLNKYNLKIVVIGDHLSIKKIINLGYLTRYKTEKLLSRTKFTINSGENPYNIFTIDAFNNHVNIIYEKSFKNNINFFKKKKLFFISLNQVNKICGIFKNKFKFESSSKSTNYQYLRERNNVYFNKVKIYYTN